MNKRIYYSYTAILKKLVQYLPSRIVIILNSFFIIPIFAYFLTSKEMSIYLIALQILNFICTCTYDWIGKAVLRFHDKYLLENRIQEFFSTTFWISVITYIPVLLGFFVFKQQLTDNFSITGMGLILTVILVIPCGIRQFLYQLLRLKNRYNLYTVSIIIYQILLLAIFLVLFKSYAEAIAVIAAMIIAICVIDVYIIRSINLKFPILWVFDKKIAANIFKYSLPMVMTNWCYWGILHIPGFLFQSMEQYWNTAIFCLGRTLAMNIIQPLAALFIFVSFPVIMRLFERKLDVKPYVTNLIRIYLFILIPIVCGMCFYSREIVRLMLDSKYQTVAVILPIWIVSSFLHELLKLINLKYHIKITTYIEFLPSFLVTVAAVYAYYWAAQSSSVVTVVLISMAAELLLLLINSLINFKNFSYLNNSELVKTLIPMLGISVLSYFAINFIFVDLSPYAAIIKIVMFLFSSYVISYLYRDRILN